MIEVATKPPIEVSTQNDKLVVILDASAFKESSCLLRLFNNTVIGYRAGINDNVIEFGTAFHLFRAHLREHGPDSFGAAVQQAVTYYKNTPMRVAPEKKYLTEAFLSTTCLGYYIKYQKDSLEVIRYPKERFGIDSDHPLVPLIEPWTKFVLPYYSDDLVDILLAGTIDEIALQSRACVLITDCKTSGVWKIKEYLDGYKLDPQLKFYVMVTEMYAELYPDSIFAELLNKYPIGAVIDGIFYKGSDAPVEYKRSDIIQFTKTSITRFKQLISVRIKQLVDAIHAWKKEGILPPEEGMLNGSCSTKFGPCKYATACAMPDEESRKIIMENAFRIEHYNPMNFGGK